MDIRNGEETRKLLEKKYWDILHEIVIKFYKGYEHGEIKEVSGKDVDRLLKNTEDYLKRLKELREDIEKRMMQKTFGEIYEDVFKIMKNLFGDKIESGLIGDYEREIVNKAKGNPKYVHTLKELVDMKKKYKNKKAPSTYDFERLRKDSVYLIQELIEYAQRKELGLLQKTKVVLTSKGKSYELLLTKPAFLVDANKIKKIDAGKISNSDVNEMNSVLANYRGGRVVIDDELMKALKKEIGDYEINL